MAIPASTSVWPEMMDPYDILDFVVDCSGMLEPNELIASHTISLLAEASALGLVINTTSPYATTVESGTSIRVWFSILPAEQGNPAFNTSATLPMELVITTNAVPPRRKQRTLAVKVGQK